MTEKVRTKNKNPEELKKRIIESARQEFCTFGYAGARIDRISKNASTTDRMLYYHFGNKEDLYKIILEDVYKDIVHAQQAFEFNEHDPEQAIKDMCSQLWHYYRTHPNFIRLVMYENLNYGEFIAQSMQIQQAPIALLEKTQSILNLGIQKKIFKADAQAELILMTIMSMGCFYLGHQYTCSKWLEKDLLQESACQQWLEHIQATVLNNLKKI